MTPPGLSVIVVFRDMAREAPRTLFTLSEAYQRGVDPSAYEVIAVDAGSALPLDAALVAALIEAGGPRFTLLRTPPSPHGCWRFCVGKIGAYSTISDKRTPTILTLTMFAV